jgi:hypothetical protein
MDGNCISNQAMIYEVYGKRDVGRRRELEMRSEQANS